MRRRRAVPCPVLLGWCPPSYVTPMTLSFRCPTVPLSPVSRVRPPVVLRVVWAPVCTIRDAARARRQWLDTPAVNLGTPGPCTNRHTTYAAAATSVRRTCRGDATPAADTGDPLDAPTRAPTTPPAGASARGHVSGCALPERGVKQECPKRSVWRAHVDALTATVRGHRRLSDTFHVGGTVPMLSQRMGGFATVRDRDERFAEGRLRHRHIVSILTTQRHGVRCCSAPPPHCQTLITHRGVEPLGRGEVC